METANASANMNSDSKKVELFKLDNSHARRCFSPLLSYLARSTVETDLLALAAIFILVLAFYSKISSRTYAMLEVYVSFLNQIRYIHGKFAVSFNCFLLSFVASSTVLATETAFREGTKVIF